jgi:hypothetical protein
MIKVLFSRFWLCATLIVLLSACAARSKTQIVQISPLNKGNSDTIKSIKCAIQQAGWNITYSDNESVSATKAFGLDNVPCTLNIRLEDKQKNTTKALFTVGSPRGVYGNGDYFSRDVVTALQNCGAKGLVIEQK